jgi:hypothetical protein
MKNFDARITEMEPDFEDLVEAGMHEDDAREYVRISSKNIAEWTVDDAEAMRILRARYKHLFDTVSNVRNEQDSCEHLLQLVREQTSHVFPASRRIASAA